MTSTLYRCLYLLVGRIVGSIINFSVKNAVIYLFHRWKGQYEINWQYVELLSFYGKDITCFIAARILLDPNLQPNA